MSNKEPRHERIISVLLRKIEAGDANEIENARTTLKKLCKKYDLDYQTVLTRGEERTEREYKYSDAKTVIVQIVLRYGGNDNVYHNKYRKVIIVDLTDAEHLEVMHAIDILVPLYRKEMRKIKDVAMHAFVNKHDLFYKGEVERPEELPGETKPLSYEEERERLARAMQINAMVETMEDATIHKRLTSG